MQTLPPPGEIIPLNGHSMHLQRSGAGSPTVILESGFGNDSLIWSLVQPAIAEFTQVVSYDRAGLGWSISICSPTRLIMNRTLALIHRPPFCKGVEYLL